MIVKESDFQKALEELKEMDKKMDVFYCLYMGKGALWRVLTLQDFDLVDYEKNQFLRDRNDDLMRFQSEDEALKLLVEKIDPQLTKVDHELLPACYAIKASNEIAKEADQ